MQRKVVSIFCLLDHNLKGRTENIGHSMTFAEAMLGTLRPVEVWAHKRCDVDDTRIRRVFTHSEFAIRAVAVRLGRGFLYWPSVVLAVITTNFLYLMATLRVPPQPGRLLCAINASMFTVVALQIYACLRPQERVVVYFQVAANRTTRFHGFVHRLLRLRNLVYATEVPAMAERYASALRLPCAVVPIPLPRRHHAQAPHRHGNSSCLVGLVIGPPRIEKGFDVLVGAIPELARELHAGYLQLQVQVDNSDQCEPRIHASITRLFELQRALPGIQVFQGPLSEAEYSARLTGSDFILLPYRQAAYSIRSSGIIMEALAMGKPVIVTQGLTFSEAPEIQPALVKCSDGDSLDLARAVRYLIANFDRLKVSASKIQTCRAEMHCPDRFIAILTSKDFWSAQPSPSDSYVIIHT